MPWKTMEVQQQRVAFVIAASRQEKRLGALCEEFGISRPTGYLWLDRFRRGGLEGIAERSRRPHRSPGQTPEEVEQRVVELRRRYPDWGARKLRVLLERQGMTLASSTIHRVLLRRQLVRVADRHRPALQRFQRAEPNQLWQMDFKSPVGWGAPVGPLAVLDDHSRYLVLLHGTWSTRAELVREQLESAFRGCGVPEAMLMDHGTPWWNAQAPTGATWLTVWLMKQGIRLYWSGYRHPQTQGKVERLHGSLSRSLRRRGVPAGEERQRWLDDYRQEYNHVRPHQALEMGTPASVWRPSRRGYDPCPAPYSYPEGAEVVEVKSNGQIWAAGRRWDLSRALAREAVQLLPVEDTILVYYRETLLGELNPRTQRSTAVERWVRCSEL